MSSGHPEGRSDASKRYKGIRFPDRAEAVGEFSAYRVFLGPWDPLAKNLQSYYEALAVRRESRVLAIFGPQGAGKTMFASKLQGDFMRTKENGFPITPDNRNLWHRVTGGEDLESSLIEEATRRSDLLLVENSSDWVKSTAEWVGARKDRTCIVIADNAERTYFRQGLVDISDIDFIKLGDSPELTTLAAQRLVAHCRTDFRGALFIVLSNNEKFLLALDSAVQEQHAGLLNLTRLPLPDGRTKETVVRVNTNRLNEVSYWYCLDKAGPEEKAAVKNALDGASTFPDSFAAVDNAIRTATPNRIGRPARQNVITLIVLSGDDDLSGFDPDEYGDLQRTEVDHEWMQLHVYSKNWAPPAMGLRESGLLESEWVFRLCVLASPIARSLAEIGSGDTGEHSVACTNLFAELQKFHGPGAHQSTRTAFTESLEEALMQWPASERSMSDFWAQGQTRSMLYENALREVIPGYNTGAEGFLTYRPDAVVSPFRPCSIVGALSDAQDAINAAIRREAHVFEFTAIAGFSRQRVQTYLRLKLPNYVEVTQEQ